MVSIHSRASKNFKILKPSYESGGGKVSITYDRQSSSEKLVSVIPHFNFTKIIRDGWLVIMLVHMLAKNAKPLKPLLKGGGGNGRGTYDRQSYNEKRVSVIPHFNLTEIIRDGLLVI